MIFFPLNYDISLYRQSDFTDYLAANVIDALPCGLGVL
jgi:hypothetical protein